MKAQLHPDEAAQRTINCAGEQEESGVYHYETEVVITISITGQGVYDTDQVAKNMALFRADEQVEVRGNGAVEKEVHVRRIGPA